MPEGSCLHRTERPGDWSSRLAGQNRVAGVIGICEQNNEAFSCRIKEQITTDILALGKKIFEKLNIP